MDLSLGLWNLRLYVNPVVCQWICSFVYSVCLFIVRDQQDALDFTFRGKGCCDLEIEETSIHIPAVPFII